MSKDEQQEPLGWIELAGDTVKLIMTCDDVEARTQLIREWLKTKPSLSRIEAVAFTLLSREMSK